MHNPMDNRDRIPTTLPWLDLKNTLPEVVFNDIADTDLDRDMIDSTAWLLLLEGVPKADHNRDLQRPETFVELHHPLI
jgi:hypothetical protein